MTGSMVGPKSFSRAATPKKRTPRVTHEAATKLPQGEVRPGPR